MSDPLKVVIGYDRNEESAFSVLARSIITRSSLPVSIIPLYLPQLETDGLMWRQDRGSTDFSFSRFLAPYMAQYRGKVLFLDCDMLVRGDIAELFDYVHADQCVSVCKHDYVPRETIKFLGNKNTVYERKLWSAVMLFNCASQKVRNLTPKAVNEMSGADLHQFAWTHDSRLGEIPEEWHFIPDHSEPRVSIEDAKLAHFTLGGPWFWEYRNCKYADLWLNEWRQTTELQIDNGS